MPIELLTRTSGEAGTDEDVQALLTGPGGAPTLEAQVIEQFISELDFSDFMEDPDLQEFISPETTWCRVTDDGDVEECDEGTPGAYAVEVEQIDGAVVTEMVDTDDLYTMFSHYVQTCLPEDNMEDMLRLHAVLNLLDEADLEEKFKKGDFRKIHAKGGAELVNRMLGAMMNKEAIKRAPKGKGYKGGDYTKFPGGYGRGTAAGLARWSKNVKSNKGKEAQLAQKTKGVKQKVGLGKGPNPLAAALKQSQKGKWLKKGILKNVKMKVTAKKGPGKAAAKAVAKGLFGKAKKLVASHDVAFTMHEGANLAGRMMQLAGRNGQKPSNEQKEQQLTGAQRKQQATALLETAR